MILENDQASAIGRRESLYLDLIRSVAALAVVVGHAATIFPLPHLYIWGHEAVIGFFVLSGYVICNAADTRERDARAFIVARLARLWSVLVPAMALTMACDYAGRTFGLHQAAYVHVPQDLPLLRLGAVLVFLSESWVSIQPLSNGVVWSLCAEFWYYMMFAAWVFAPHGRLRVALVAAACVLAGHKALLLLPIWLMGVALQRSRWLRSPGPGESVALFAGSCVIIAALLLAGVSQPLTHIMEGWVGPFIYRQLAQARLFWFDWLLGALFAAHLAGARRVMASVPLDRIAAPVRACAGVSFAAYLFHVPVLDFWAAFLPQSQGWLAIALTLAVIATLGAAAEHSKPWWRRTLDRLSRSQGFKNFMVPSPNKVTGQVGPFDVPSPLLQGRGSGKGSRGGTIVFHQAPPPHPTLSPERRGRGLFQR
jgi:peptidoglycan/LPS O-acetylase OafA/YrhL